VRGKTPWAAGIMACLRDATSGQVLEGRGGMAVAPGRAVRIILLMAGGPTLLDVWVTPDRWRVAVPVRGTVERGTEDVRADLPVSFLRRWFLHPFEGTLVAVSASGAEPGMLVRDGEAVLEIRVGRCDGGDLTRTIRRIRDREVERIDECLAPGGPRPGNWARYVNSAGGLSADVTFESVSVVIPDESAFVEPETTGLSRE